jgi:hypothetical protein
MRKREEFRNNDRHDRSAFPAPGAAAAILAAGPEYVEWTAGTTWDPYLNVGFRSAGFDLIGGGAECNFPFLKPTDIFLGGADPMLGPLQENGGPTPTHALLPGSPALGSITSRGRLCKNPDRRGVPRTPPCDIGAYEAP